MLGQLTELRKALYSLLAIIIKDTVQEQLNRRDAEGRVPGQGHGAAMLSLGAPPLPHLRVFVILEGCHILGSHSPPTCLPSCRVPSLSYSPLFWATLPTFTCENGLATLRDDPYISLASTPINFISCSHQVQSALWRAALLTMALGQESCLGALLPPGPPAFPASCHEMVEETHQLLDLAAWR